jgi:hydrogenase maturation protease
MHTQPLSKKQCATKPVLIFAYGNPSRGDDALAPMLLELLQDSTITLQHCELLTDFQLQIEHALDLEQRQLVLFIDASVSCPSSWQLTQLQPQYDNSYTTHEMSPAAVLQVYQAIKHEPPPPSFLLSIRAEQFELGAALGKKAQENLTKAHALVLKLLSSPSLDYWQQSTNNA